MSHTPRFGSVTLNQEHYDNPQIGDGWQEHYCYHFIIVDVLPSGNVVIVPIERIDQGQLAQYDKAYELNKEQFYDEIHYRHGTMRNTFHLHVVPGHLDVVRVWKNQYKGNYLAKSSPVKKTVVICGFRGVGKSQLLNICLGEKKVMEASPGGGVEYYSKLVSSKLVSKPPEGLDILLLPADPIVYAALAEAKVKYHMVYPHASLCSVYLHRIHRRGATACDIHRFKADWHDNIHDCHYQPGCVHWQLQDRQYLIDVLAKIIHMEHLDDAIWAAIEKKIVAKAGSKVREYLPV